MSKYTTILFDADATLFDFKRSEYDAVKDCLTFAGLPNSDEVIEKYSEINDGYWKMLERKEITKKELMVARWQSLLDHYSFNFDANILSEMYPKKLAEKSFLISFNLNLKVKNCEVFQRNNFLDVRILDILLQRFCLHKQNRSFRIPKQ